MTINEIKSVSICQWMQENGYGAGRRNGKNVFFYSPFRKEKTPSFVVNTKDNLWCDFGNGNRGGNLITLVEQLNPTWTEHQVLAFLEKQIQEKKLAFNIDFNASLEEKEKQCQRLAGKHYDYSKTHDDETVVEMVLPLNNHVLISYLMQRHIDVLVAQRFCREVYYTLRGKRYFAIAFMNVANGMEARNRINKRCIGKKSISVIYPLETHQKHCCIFEGFFDMLSYATIERHFPDKGISMGFPCDFFVLNGVGEVKLLLPYLAEYEFIHCYLDNDEAGETATRSIISSFTDKVTDESYRYKGYNDLNDFLTGKR